MFRESSTRLGGVFSQAVCRVVAHDQLEAIDRVAEVVVRVVDDGDLVDDVDFVTWESGMLSM